MSRSGCGTCRATQFGSTNGWCVSTTSGAAAPGPGPLPAVVHGGRCEGQATTRDATAGNSSVWTRPRLRAARTEPVGAGLIAGRAPLTRRRASTRLSLLFGRSATPLVPVSCSGGARGARHPAGSHRSGATITDEDVLQDPALPSRARTLFSQRIGKRTGHRSRNGGPLRTGQAFAPRAVRAPEQAQRLQAADRCAGWSATRRAPCRSSRSCARNTVMPAATASSRTTCAWCCWSRCG